MCVHFNYRTALYEKYSGFQIQGISYCLPRDTLKFPLFLLQKGEIITKSLGLEICDGAIDCLPDGQDEWGCTYDENTFRCTTPGNRVNIPMEKTCDGIVDCSDGKDEDQQLCEDFKFYCSTRNGSAVSSRSLFLGTIFCTVLYLTSVKKIFLKADYFL